MRDEKYQEKGQLILNQSPSTPPSLRKIIFLKGLFPMIQLLILLLLEACMYSFHMDQLLPDGI